MALHQRSAARAGRSRRFQLGEPTPTLWCNGTIDEGERASPELCCAWLAPYELAGRVTPRRWCGQARSGRLCQRK